MKKLGIILSVVLVLASVLTVCAACNTHYDLSYAAWNLGTETAPSIERKMVQEFEKLHNVKIELKEVASGNAYEDSINGLIIRKEAPDVFMINNTNYVLNGQHGYDLTELTKSDSDWNNIPAALEQPAHYKSGIYAVPFAMHIQGYFVNTTLLEEQGKEFELPANGECSWEWFYNVVTKLKLAKNADQTIMGLTNEESIYRWYPSAVNKDLDYFTWDGSQYHLDEDEFVTGMNLTSSLYSGGYSFESLDADTREANFEGITDAVDLWNKGRVAIRWGSTYEMPDMIEKSGGFNIQFIGIPFVEDAGENARTENFVSLVPDYISIYKGTSNPELAYEFAKWMTFSPEGIAKRIELDSDKGVTNAMPVTTNPETLETYFETFTAVDGLEKMYDRLDNAITECVKIVPGFNSVQYLASTGISVTDASGATIANANMGQFFDACRQGRLTYRDYKGDVDKIADEQYANAVKNYENKYN